MCLLPEYLQDWQGPFYLSREVFWLKWKIKIKLFGLTSNWDLDLDLLCSVSSPKYTQSTISVMTHHRDKVGFDRNFIVLEEIFLWMSR